MLYGDPHEVSGLVGCTLNPKPWALYDSGRITCGQKTYFISNHIIRNPKNVGFFFYRFFTGTGKRPLLRGAERKYKLYSIPRMSIK